MCSVDCMDCKNELNLCKLCAKRAVIKHLCVDHLETEEVCAPLVEAGQLNVDQEVANDICVSGTVSATNVAAINLNANNLCSQSGTINTLCVDNLTAGNSSFYQKYRAAVTFSASNLYTLGSNIDWDVILDDPNNNVAVGPFSYTVPVSGYYVINFYTNTDSLTGAATISGLPVSLLSVSANNLQLRQFNAPYLAFSSKQYASLSAIVLLNAGDVLRMTYNVQVVDSVLGEVNYVGTVNMNGNGLFPDSSGFEIHLLSLMSQSNPGNPCIICPQVMVGCQPVTIPCMDGTPCDPCNPAGAPKSAPQSKPAEPIQAAPMTALELREQRKLQRERERK